jgi:tRNA-specific 2-thiouridylase
MRVVAALSGGVDSSVAAARMVDAGHDVVGIHLALARAESTGDPAVAARSTMHEMPVG